MDTFEYAVTFRETREITVWVDATDDRDARQRARKQYDEDPDQDAHVSNVLTFELVDVTQT